MGRELDLYTKIHQQRWMDILENHEHMKQTVLKMMENPATGPEQLALAHKAYASVCKALQETSFILDVYLRTGVKPTDEQVKNFTEVVEELKGASNGQS